MRTNHPTRAAILLGSIAVTAATIAIPASATPTPTPTPTPKDTHTVTYHGYQADVPATWRIVDLTKDPTTCVRFDQPTVYLGHPGADQQCPSDLTGGAPAMIVEPLDSTSATRLGPDAVRIPKGAATPTAGASGRVSTVVESAGVVVTTVGNADQSITATLTADAQRTTLDSIPRPTQTSETRAPIEAPGSYTGEGFDACAAPSQDAMTAWLESPYRTVGVYMGGISRACDQPNLTADWLQAQADAGWHFIPIYVGLQASCNDYPNEMSSDPATARSQGAAEADDAVAQAEALGMPAGSVIYNDMEAYDNTDSTCSTAVLSYLAGWTDRLHELSYFSGVYSSASSGVADLSANYDNPDYTRPDHIWFALWNDAHDVDPGGYFGDDQWASQQRIHQYSGGHDETYGGVTINIDGDYLDVVPPGAVGPSCSANLDFEAYPDLAQGSTGAEVTAAECMLLRQGRTVYADDGYYGRYTVAAVTEFQTEVGLSATGAIDSLTWTALLSAGSQPALQNGSSGADVSRLQRSLTAALGQSVVIDGDFGPATEEAVRSYQTSRNLTVDGIVGAETWGALQAGT